MIQERHKNHDICPGVKMLWTSTGPGSSIFDESSSLVNAEAGESWD